MGCRQGAAHHGFHAVNNHVLGYTLQELTMEFDTAGRTQVRPSTSSSRRCRRTPTHSRWRTSTSTSTGDTGSSFELVLDLILDGLATLPAITEPPSTASRRHPTPGLPVRMGAARNVTTCVRTECANGEVV
ncbi:MAG: TetR/AcrR family transcriptional regulator C-terminal domain-containing protein [Acidimicrobiaceae bacterium]|nr:TetR/AcrR family transcriptional regulator C-terminal domain-containing protein [Acidimicrobiaceae bacterium]